MQFNSHIARSQTWKKTLKTYKRMNAGLVEILKYVFQSFNACRGSEAAASISYYAIFSVFPLILALITIGSHVLNEVEIQQYLFEWSEQIFPTMQNFLVRNVQSVLSLRGPVGVGALIGLLWSGTTVFYILVLNINRAFPDANLHTFIKARLFALAMVGIMIGLLFLSLFFNTLVSILSSLQLPLPGFSNYESFFLQAFTVATPIILMLLIFFYLYNLVPNTKVDMWASFWGALVTVCLLQLATSIFSWIIQNGFVRYELIYGSLATICTLMLYIYLTALIILLGAHLTSAIQRFKCYARLRK